MRPKKSLGQNFLKDKNIIRRISHLLSESVPKESFLIEIGPGKGALTRELLKLNPKRLLLIEKDRELLPFLQDVLNDNRMELVIRDVRRFDWETLHNFYLIANIPYYITGDIIEIMARNVKDLKCAFLMIQRELLDKIKAKAGAKRYSYFSVICSMFFDVSEELSVGRNSFYPAPKVDSAFVKFTPHNLQFVYDDASRILRSAFMARRKSLWNNLTKVYNNQLIEQCFDVFEIDKKARPQDIPVSLYEKMIGFLLRHRLEEK